MRAQSYALMVLLILPMLQTFKPIIWAWPLVGESRKPTCPELSISDYWNGDYQTDFERWHRTSFGFRGVMIRIQNQLDFVAFGKVSGDVIVGKDNYLFSEKYLHEWSGEGYLGEGAINEIGTKLLAIQNGLSKQGKTLVVALAPGKPTFFPEYVPSRYVKRGLNNGESMSAIFQEMGVNLIDYNDVFQEQKGESAFPLFGRTGIHWSNYGSAISLQILMKRLEKLRMEKLPTLVIDRAVESVWIYPPDDDLGQLMNMVYPIQSYPMAVIDVSWERSYDDKPRQLTAFADSFFQQFVGKCRLVPGAFDSVHYYYYHDKVWFSESSPADAQKFETASIEGAINSIKDSDVVLIMVTEANYGVLGFRYLDPLYEHFVGSQKGTEEPISQ